MSHDRLLTYKDLKGIYGIPWCRQHIWRLEKAGVFPLRRRFGNRRVVWRQSDIEFYLKPILDP